MNFVHAMVAAVEHHRAVFQFDRFALVEPVLRFGADFPGLSVVVAVDDMAVVGLRPARRQRLVVARYDQAAFVLAALELNARAGACGVPAPVLQLYRSGDFLRRAPGLSVVVGVGDKDATRILPVAGPDLSLVNLGTVPSVQAPDPAGRLIHDGAGVARHVTLFVEDDDLVSPGLAAIFTAADDAVDVGRVPTAVASCLCECQYRAFLCYHQRGNTVGVRPWGAAPVEGLPFRQENHLAVGLDTVVVDFHCRPPRSQSRHHAELVRLAGFERIDRRGCGKLVDRCDLLAIDGPRERAVVDHEVDVKRLARHDVIRGIGEDFRLFAEGWPLRGDLAEPPVEHEPMPINGHAGARSVDFVDRHSCVDASVRTGEARSGIHELVHAIHDERLVVLTIAFAY